MRGSTAVRGGQRNACPRWLLFERLGRIMAHVHHLSRYIGGLVHAFFFLIIYDCVASCSTQHGKTVPATCSLAQLCEWFLNGV